MQVEAETHNAHVHTDVHVHVQQTRPGFPVTSVVGVKGCVVTLKDLSKVSGVISCKLPLPLAHADLSCSFLLSDSHHPPVLRYVRICVRCVELISDVHFELVPLSPLFQYRNAVVKKKNSTCLKCVLYCMEQTGICHHFLFSFPLMCHNWGLIQEQCKEIDNELM